jgi:hypothetical protein
VDRRSNLALQDAMLGKGDCKTSFYLLEQNIGPLLGLISCCDLLAIARSAFQEDETGEMKEEDLFVIV